MTRKNDISNAARRVGLPLSIFAAIVALGCPSADREKTTDPGPADGGETGAPATPDTEALEAKLEEAESARMSCEAELAECKATPEQ